MFSNFIGKGSPISAADIAGAVAALGCDAPSIWSVLAVETRGFGYLKDRRPQILFERHIFCNRTNGVYSAAHPDISNPTPGGYSGGAAEYDRLARAMALNEVAALESASWGLGQIMGFNAKSAGFGGVQAMVTAMVADESAQLRATAKFISSNAPLLRALQAKAWARFAFFYNGKAYSKNHYDLKLEHNYNLYVNPATIPDIDLRTAQACLTYLNFDPKGVDGVLGQGTRVAIQSYRKARNLPPGGLDAPLLAQLSQEANI